jgi:hypothetical protein
MAQTFTLLDLKSNGQTAIEHLISCLEQAEFLVIRSFDLKTARSAQVGCSCPHHGTDQCDCQMVVLLVYDQTATPVTLIFHGRDGRSELTLLNTIELSPSYGLIYKIMTAITLSSLKLTARDLNV